MTSTTPARRSPLALAVLALLWEAPMHPYRMQQLLKQRDKDLVVNVRQRASLYQTIERLQRAGLIRVRETARPERWPERTIYELTDEGRRTAVAWLRAMLATPAREFPEFPAAVSLLAMLTPEDALAQLATRLRAQEDELASIDSKRRQGEELRLPRLFLLELEYLRAVLSAELEWVRSLIDDLGAGRLTWSEEWTRQVADRLGSAGDDGEEPAMT